MMLVDTCSCGAPLSMLPADHVCVSLPTQDERIAALQAERDGHQIVAKRMSLEFTRRDREAIAFKDERDALQAEVERLETAYRMASDFAKTEQDRAEALQAERDWLIDTLGCAQDEAEALRKALEELLSGHDNLYAAHFGPNSNPHDDIAAKAARAALASHPALGGEDAIPTIERLKCDLGDAIREEERGAADEGFDRGLRRARDIAFKVIDGKWHSLASEAARLKRDMAVQLTVRDSDKEAAEAKAEALQAENERLRKWTGAAETALDEGVSAKIAAEAKAETIRRETIEACAKVAETDKRSDLAKNLNYKPEWHRHGERIAARIRSLAAGETQP